jgi:hypothetical protein
VLCIGLACWVSSRVFCTSDMLVEPSSMQGHSFLRRACYKVSDGNPSFAEMNAVSPFHALSLSSSFIFVMYCSSRHITILTLSLLGAALISLSLPLPFLFQKRTHSVALDKVGLKRYCCRRMVLTHVDLISKLLNYNTLAKAGYLKDGE